MKVITEKQRRSSYTRWWFNNSIRQMLSQCRIYDLVEKTKVTFPYVLNVSLRVSLENDKGKEIWSTSVLTNATILPDESD